MTLPNRELLDVPTEAPTPHANGYMGVDAEAAAHTQWQLFRRRFLRHRMAVVSAVVLLVIIVGCFGASWLAPYPKNKQNLLLSAVGPNLKHWFGTDDLGRDQLTEIMYAGQISPRIGLAGAFLSTVGGPGPCAFAGPL